MTGSSPRTRSENPKFAREWAPPFGGFQTFTTLPSNINALEAAMRFSNGSSPHVVLTGPSGWGKSHLLLSAEDAILNSAGTVSMMSALQWCSAHGKHDFPDLLILDDVQDVINHSRARHVLRQTLDLRARKGRKSLLAWTSCESAKRIRALLPSGREWEFASIVEPSVDERELVVLQIARELRVTLSPATARLVAKHLNGNGRSIRGAIQRLRLVKTDWSARTDVMPACGVLSPYLLGHNGWDPRDQVQEAIAKSFGDKTSGLSRNDVSCYLMLHEMGLSETEVATFLKVSPSAAYSHCRKVKAQIAESPAAGLIEACRNAVLLGFEGG